MNSDRQSLLSPRTKFIIRLMLMAATFSVFVAIGFVGGLMIPESKLPWNHLQPLASPSGKYVLTVPVEKDAGMASGMWRVTISDLDGNELYKDRDSEFVGYLMSYWVWDAQDRVWLYDSDSGGVHYWELIGGSWKKREWESASRNLGKKNREESTTANSIQLQPPASLFPGDARVVDSSH